MVGIIHHPYHHALILMLAELGPYGHRHIEANINSRIGSSVLRVGAPVEFDSSESADTDDDLTTTQVPSPRREDDDLEGESDDITADDEPLRFLITGNCGG